MTAMNMLTRPSRNANAMTTDQLRAVAPSIFTGQAMQGLSDRYAFISTETVVNDLIGAGFVPVRAAEARVRREGGEGYAKHAIAFRHRDAINFDATQGRDLTATLGHSWIDGGHVLPEIMMTNSHDGTGSFVLDAGLFRLACLNGLIVCDQSIASMRVRHIGAATSGKVIDAAYEIVNAMPAVIDNVKDWQALQLPAPAQTAFANAALQLRWDNDDNGNSKAPIDVADLLRTRRASDRAPTLWNTLNVVQENVIRGGISGRGATGRRLHTRAVNAPAENIRLNKALWQLASTVAKVMKEGDKALESLKAA